MNNQHTFDVRTQFVVIQSLLRSDNLIDRQGLLVEVTLNDGHRVEWKTIEALECENVLRPITSGGFSLRHARDMMERGEILDETGALFDL